MERRPLLVAGIDPGTTIGFALLDLDSSVVLLESSKQLPLDLLIKRTMELGRVILVGCDKKKVPELVEKFAVKFGVKPTAPPQDMLTREKKALVCDIPARNSHEFDALASALYALKEATPLLRKIRVFAGHYHKESIMEKIAELVIKKGVGIRLAADMIEKPDTPEVMSIKKVIREESVPKKRVLQLYENLAQEKAVLKLLREQNQGLRDEMHNLKSLTAYLRKKINCLASDEKAEELLRLRKEQIEGLSSQLNAMSSEIGELKEELSKQRLLTSELGEKTLVKKLRNLGSEEFEKKSKFLKIRQNDILLVDEPGIVSDAVLQRIQKLNNVLIVKKKMSAKTLQEIHIPVLNAGDVNLEETRYFAAVDKQAIEGIKSDTHFLQKLVRKYQESRK